MIINTQNLLWLFLPIAAISGWLVAKLDSRLRVVRKPQLNLPEAYFKGLNYLLNEEPDKAVDIFIRVLEVNSATAETHLALGNLFRRKGEVERAIRIHQNLIACSSLDPIQQSQALLELGQDYLKAGLYDRAENLFIELAENEIYSELATQHLLHIYQQERDWHKAIITCDKLARLSGKPMADRVAQYYCELAEGALANQDFNSANQWVAQALDIDADCVRASIIEGDINAKQGKYREAIKAWKRIEQQDAHFLGEVADRIAKCFKKLGDEAGLRQFFDSMLERHNSAEMMLVLGDIIRERDGVEVAESFIIDWLRRKPSVHGLYRLIDLNVWKTGNTKNQDLKLLKGIIGELKNQHEGYVCQQCGFKGRSLHWQCPGCHNWNTIRPVVEE